MPYTIIILWCKREDITFNEFKDRLENNFVPLLEKLTGPLFPLTYVRRYVAHKGNDENRSKEGALGLPALIVGREEQILWDCLLEATYEDDLHMQQFFAFLNEEEIAEQLLACENTFSDIHKLRIITMESTVSMNKSRKMKTWEEYDS